MKIGTRSRNYLSAINFKSNAMKQKILSRINSRFQSTGSYLSQDAHVCLGHHCDTIQSDHSAIGRSVSESRMFLGRQRSSGAEKRHRSFEFLFRGSKVSLTFLYTESHASLFPTSDIINKFTS